MLKEQLSVAQPLFDKVRSLIVEGDYMEVYRLIDESEPHPDWILELPSKTNPKEKFKTMKLETMEALMRALFGVAKLHSISSPIITQDRGGKFAVTVSIVYEYILGMSVDHLHGIATVTCSDISMLELATPKASSMAIKNALKQLGGLFGKYLNNMDIAEEELPAEERKMSPEEQIDAVTSGILAAKTVQDLRSYRHLVFSKMSTKDVQELYETTLRQLSEKSSSITSK